MAVDVARMLQMKRVRHYIPTPHRILEMASISIYFMEPTCLHSA